MQPLDNILHLTSKGNPIADRPSMKKAFLFLLLLTKIATYGQQTISGTVVDAETGAPLPYVNIGVTERNLGTVSNIEGKFSLKIPESAKQAPIRFSILGYESRTFASRGEFLETFSGATAEVEMKPSPMELEDIEITGKRYKEKIIGSQTQTQLIVSGFLTDKLGCEIGVKIKLGKKKPAWVQEFRFHVAQNRYDTAFFRVNIYELDENDMPVKNLLTESTVVAFTEESGPVVVDLKEQQIFAEGDFYVGLEYIRELTLRPEIIAQMEAEKKAKAETASGEGASGKKKDEERQPINLSFSSGLLGPGVYSRHTSQGRWKKVTGINLGFNVLVKY